MTGPASPPPWPDNAYNTLIEPIKCHAGLSGIKWDKWDSAGQAAAVLDDAGDDNADCRARPQGRARGRWGCAPGAEEWVLRAAYCPSLARRVARALLSLPPPRPVFSRVSGRDPDAESAPGAPHHGPGRTRLRGHARFKQSRARPQGRARGTCGRARPQGRARGTYGRGRVST